jgi:hypothetical protein
MKTKNTDLKNSSKTKMSSEQELADNICAMIEAYSRRTGFSIEHRKNIHQNHVQSAEKFIKHAEQKLQEAKDSRNLSEIVYGNSILNAARNKKCMCWNCRLIRMYEFFDFERNDSINKTETIAK